MQIRNKLKIHRYVIGTTINVVGMAQFFSTDSYPVLFVFVLCVLANQYIMAIIVSEMIGLEENNSKIPNWLLPPLKILSIIGGFYYAMSNTSGMEFFLISIYIFQLIILVLSIKRVVKKT